MSEYPCNIHKNSATTTGDIKERLHCKQPPMWCKFSLQLLTTWSVPQTMTQPES